jgi:trimethylamine--corrinoid protein Co-methyltransferase
MNGIISKIEIINPAEIQMIHSASLNILEQTGFKCPNEDCLSICEQHGALVDRQNQVVKIPLKVMEDLLDLVRSKKIMDPDNYKISNITGAISTQVFLVDYQSRQRRYGLLDDVKKGIVLVENLKNITTNNAVIIPSDVPFNESDLISFQNIYTYSNKPGGTFILSPISAHYIIEMSKIMERKVSFLFDTVSPLQFTKGTLDIALVFARAGMPLTMTSMVMGGTTGPVTIAGTITLENAESLACLFMIYALTHEFPVYTSAAHSSDLRTSLCSFGSPNQALFGIGMSQMARFYGLPSTSNSGLSDALTADFQSGIEKAITASLSCLSGAVGMGYQGIAGADQGFSFEQLVLDNEWIDYYNYITRGFEVSEETLALDIIKNVGIGGNFIVEEHTVMNMDKNYYDSKIFARDSWEAWKEKGSKDALDTAHDFVEDVTSGYKEFQPVISPGMVDSINQIVTEAQKELASLRINNAH